MWRERFRERWPLAVAIGVGCAGPTMILQLARPLGEGLRLTLLGAFVVVWIMITAWLAVRANARERQRRARERRARSAHDGGRYRADR